MDEHWHHLVEFFSKIVWQICCLCTVSACEKNLSPGLPIHRWYHGNRFQFWKSWSPCRIWWIWMYLVHHPHRHFFITHVIRVWSIGHQPPGSISASFASKMTHRLGPFNGGHPVARKPGNLELRPRFFCGIKILVTEALWNTTVKSVFFSDRAWVVSAGRWRHVSLFGGLSWFVYIVQSPTPDDDLDWIHEASCK